MFDSTVLRTNYNKKLFNSPNGFAVCKFGAARVPSLAAISQTQDKLIVLDVSDEGSNQSSSRGDDSIILISINDVVCSVATCSSGAETASTSRLSDNFLLIGCTNCTIIYDCFSQTNLFRISTATKINAFSLNANSSQFDGPLNVQSSNEQLLICGGTQKIYAMRLNGMNSGEISSEKGTSDSICCLIRGTFQGVDIVITGSVEQKIRLYQIDSFDYNIQPCELTLNECAQVNCLLGINSEMKQESLIQTKDEQSLIGINDQQASTLPSLGEKLLKPIIARPPLGEQLSYFAYGLENGLVGLYRLYRDANQPHRLEPQSQPAKFMAERLWRHKAKQTPTSMQMFDINADGFEELIIGYKSGRLEARSPLTGQLLAATRCFKSDVLAGLVVSFSPNIGNESGTRDVFGLEAHKQQQQTKRVSTPAEEESSSLATLIVCSSSGHLIGYRPRKACKRKALPSFEATQQLDEPLFGDAGLDDGAEVEDWLKAELNLTTIDESEEQEAAKLSLRANEDNPMEVFAVDQDIDDETQASKAIPCEARQNLDLLRQISCLLNEQKLLEQKTCDVYHNTMQQVTALAKLATTKMLPGDQSFSLAYKWGLNCETLGKNSIVLTILVGSSGSSGELVDFVEIIDFEENSEESHKLLSPERSLAKVDDHEDELRATTFTYTLECKPNRARTLNVSVYCSLESSNSRSKVTDHHTLAHIYQRAIVVPKFCNLLPDEKIQTSSEEIPVVRTQFKLGNEELADQLTPAVGTFVEVLEWLGQNLLCLRADHWISEDGKEQSYWLERIYLVDEEEHSLSSGPPVALMRLLHNEPLLGTIERWSNGAKQPDEDHYRHRGEPQFELRLNYYHDNHELKSNSLLVICCGQDYLRVESDNYHLLVDIVQSLAVEHLKLKITPECVESQPDGKHGIRPILDSLEQLNKKSRDLEESERRVQTELYEAADLTQNLMQQFHIAQQINEYSIAKELLSEISMIFNEAQNSARAYYLNNRERLRLTKDAGRLREKISFLLGS